MLLLRKMTQSDLPVFTRWLRAPHVARWYRDPDGWIAEVRQQDGAFRWIRHFIAERDGVPVGFCQYYAGKDSDEDWLALVDRHGTYSIDYLIGEESCLGKGLGKQIVACLEEAIRCNGDAKRIAVQPDKANAASCRLLLSCGFSLTNPESGIYVKQL